MAFADATALTPVSLSPRVAASVATLSSADGTNGNKFTATHDTILRVVNGSASSITVTVNSVGEQFGLAVADATFTVAASGDVLWSGFESIFWQNDSKQVHVEYSSATSVTVQVIQPL